MIVGLIALSTWSIAESSGVRISALSLSTYQAKQDSVHCADWNDEFVLCPLKIVGNGLEFTNMTQITSNLLLDQMRRQSVDSVTTTRFSFQGMEGSDQGYWATGAQDGFDAAGWLHPQKLERIAGGPVMAAQPSRGTFCFWSKLSTDIHKNMAVGIKETYNSSGNPVSPKIYQWDGEQWTVWGEAIPSTESSEKDRSEKTGSKTKNK